MSDTDVLLTAQFEAFFQDPRTTSIGHERDQAFKQQSTAAQLAFQELLSRGIDHFAIVQAIDFIGGGIPNGKMNRDETIKYAISLITPR